MQPYINNNQMPDGAELCYRSMLVTPQHAHATARFDTLASPLFRRIDPVNHYEEFLKGFRDLDADQRKALTQDPRFIAMCRGICTYELLKRRPEHAAQVAAILDLNNDGLITFYQGAIYNLLLDIADPERRSVQVKLSVINAIEDIGEQALEHVNSVRKLLSREQIGAAVRDAFEDLIATENFLAVSDQLGALSAREQSTLEPDNFSLPSLLPYYPHILPPEFASFSEFRSFVAEQTSGAMQHDSVKCAPLRDSGVSFPRDLITNIYIWVHGSSSPVSADEMQLLRDWIDDISERQDIGVIIVPWIPRRHVELTHALEYGLGPASKSDYYARFLIEYHGLMRELGDKLGSRALLWREKFVDFSKQASVDAISAHFNTDLSPENRNTIAIECFGQLPNECVSVQMYDMGMREFSAHISGGGLLPSYFPEKTTQVITPGDAFASRNVTAINLLSASRQRELVTQYGLLDISCGEHVICNIGTGFFPYDTLEILAILKRDYPNFDNLRVIGTELRGVPTRAHIRFPLSGDPSLLVDMIAEVDRKSGALFSSNYGAEQGVLVIGKKRKVFALALECYVEDNEREKGMVLVDSARGVQVKQFGSCSTDERSHSLLERAIAHIGGTARIDELLRANHDICRDGISVELHPIRRAIEKAGGQFAKIQSVENLEENSASIITVFNVTVHMTEEEQMLFTQTLGTKLRECGLLLIRERDEISAYKRSAAGLDKIFKRRVHAPRPPRDDSF